MTSNLTILTVMTVVLVSCGSRKHGGSEGAKGTPVQAPLQADAQALLKESELQNELAAIEKELKLERHIKLDDEAVKDKASSPSFIFAFNNRLTDTQLKTSEEIQNSLRAYVSSANEFCKLSKDTAATASVAAKARKAESLSKFIDARIIYSKIDSDLTEALAKAQINADVVFVKDSKSENSNQALMVYDPNGPTSDLLAGRIPQQWNRDTILSTSKSISEYLDLTDAIVEHEGVKNESFTKDHGFHNWLKAKAQVYRNYKNVLVGKRADESRLALVTSELKASGIEILPKLDGGNIISIKRSLLQTNGSSEASLLVATEALANFAEEGTTPENSKLIEALRVLLNTRHAMVRITQSTKNIADLLSVDVSGLSAAAIKMTSASAQEIFAADIKAISESAGVLRTIDAENIVELSPIDVIATDGAAITDAELSLKPFGSKWLKDYLAIAEGLK